MKDMTPTFKAWRAMIRACSNPSSPVYQSVGGVGIDVCGRWRQHYEFFLDDMGPCPKGGTLIRKNLSKDFTPENCEWSV